MLLLQQNETYDWQVNAPTVELNFPAPQSVHTADDADTALNFPAMHATQLLLSADGSNPTTHWQTKVVGSLMALATQEQWLEPEPAAEPLLNGARAESLQGRQGAESPMAGLKVEEGHRRHGTGPLTEVRLLMSKLF